MILIRRMTLLLVGSCYLISAWPLMAHQQKAAITTLLFNDRSGYLEVSHRFYLHDAEHALKHLLQSKADLLSDPTSQERFGHYVKQHFGLRISESENAQWKPLALSYVGHELEGKFFWVYQQVSIPRQVSALAVFHDALQELWPAQENLVNIEGRGSIKSLRLRAKDQWQRVDIQKQSKAAF